MVIELKSGILCSSSEYREVHKKGHNYYHSNKLAIVGA